METKELFFSPEEVQAISGYVGIKPDTTWPYVPTMFRLHVKDKSKWPIYILKQPNGIDQAKEEDHLGFITVTSEGKLDSFKTRSGDLRLFRLKRNIVGAKNHRSISGEILPYTREKDEDGTEVASNAFIMSMQKALQIDIDTAIKMKTELTDAEKLGLDF